MYLENRHTTLRVVWCLKRGVGGWTSNRRQEDRITELQLQLAPTPDLTTTSQQPANSEPERPPTQPEHQPATASHHRALPSQPQPATSDPDPPASGLEHEHQFDYEHQPEHQFDYEHQHQPEHHKKRLKKVK